MKKEVSENATAENKEKISEVPKDKVPKPPKPIGQNWAFIFYPNERICEYLESVDSFQPMLTYICECRELQGAIIGISPLHKPDLKPGDDYEPKKHIHILLKMPKNIRDSGALKLRMVAVDRLQKWCYQEGLLKDDNTRHLNRRFQKKCQKVSNFSSYARYLFHLDNPEKEQFSDLTYNEFFNIFPKINFLAQTEEGRAMNLSTLVLEAQAMAETGKINKYTDFLTFYLTKKPKEVGYTEYAQTFSLLRMHRGLITQVIKESSGHQSKSRVFAEGYEDAIFGSIIEP